MKKPFFTVWIFARLSTKRFFRDRLALFFGIAFPVIFLFVFGLMFGRGGDVSFRVGFINQSDSAIATEFAGQVRDGTIFKVDKSVNTFDEAYEKMNRSQLDATIVLPADFGDVRSGQSNPSGRAKVIYTPNNEQAGRAITSVIDAQFKGLNGNFVTVVEPFTVTGEPTQNKSLSRFDYAFAGLLGFSIVGLGIFGPINVFPELKKQGILRRLHTTPLRVWQYFVSTAMSQATVGLVAMAVLFLFAVTLFNLQVVGNYIEIILFLILSIVTILGIGLAVGGWAHNERQAAPLGNIVVFPMLFLSGTFFPRYIMPEWLQSVSNWLPLTPIIEGVRLLITEGKHLVDILPQIALIGVWLIVIYIIAFRVFRWE